MKPIIKHFTSCLALAMAFLATLSSCGKDDATDDRLPDGKYPITFTAAMEGLTVEKAASRATTGGTWEGNEEVAVRIGSEVKKYTAAADGTLTVATGVTPWYWQNTTEQKTVSAWYPHNAAQLTTFTVQTDQNGGGYQSSDIIYAAPTTISFRSNALTFRHLPTKVVVNLKNGEGVTAEEVSNATVSIENQATTSGTITADWNVAQTTTGNSAIIPNVLSSAASGYQKSVQALLVPQKSIASAKFIKITIGLQEFYYSTTPDFAAGKQYTYNITVLKSGITVTASGATEWTGTEKGVTSKEIATGFTASDLKIGDYYYLDGTTGDGGYREYIDGSKATLPIMPVLTDASGKARTVIGIVYWVGDPTNTTNGDPFLARDNSGCTHGLVVALHVAKLPSAATRMTWSNGLELVNSWTNHSDRGVNKLNIAVENKLQGYANTVVLKAYNNESSNVLGNANFRVLPIVAIEQYSTDYPSPTGSSGWYLPSIMELKYMCWGQGNGQSTIGRDLLNGQFAKAGGTKLDTSYRYWSSSEHPSRSGRSSSVNFNNGVATYDDKDGHSLWVRAIFAF